MAWFSIYEAQRLKTLAVIFSVVWVAFLSGCAGTSIIAKAPTVEDADDAQATCKIARDPLNPLVVEWPGTAKVELETSSRRGLVAVSYAGCTMKILSDCEIEGTYELESTTPARDRIEIADTNELYAKLPLGAASLKGEFQNGSGLELDYVAVGQRLATSIPQRSSGDSCRTATHYVRTITVGAFRLSTRASGKIGASVEVGSAGGGLGREESERRLRSQGDVDKCASAGSREGCDAILQLGLAPLAVNKGDVQAAGFGEGLDPVAQLDAMQTVELDAGAKSSFAKLDIRLLELADLAIRAEKVDDIPAEKKALAWRNLADYESDKGENPMRERAAERSKAWGVRAEQEARQTAALLKLKERYLADKETLARVLALKEDTVSTEKKAALQAEFEEVYGPRKADLARVGIGTSSTKDAPADGPPSESLVAPGLANFGHLALEVELGIQTEFNASAVTFAGHDGDTIRTECTDFAENCNGTIAAGTFTGGLVVGLTEILPAGFGFYGRFAGAFGGPTPILGGSGGVRWDYRLTPRGTLNVGVGGGYVWSPATFFADTNTALGTGQIDADEDSIQGLKGPKVEAFAGIGLHTGAYMTQFRLWFDAKFMSGETTGPNGLVDAEVQTSLSGGLGGMVGLTL